MHSWRHPAHLLSVRAISFQSQRNGQPVGQLLLDLLLILLLLPQPLLPLRLPLRLLLQRLCQALPLVRRRLSLGISLVPAGLRRGAAPSCRSCRCRACALLALRLWRAGALRCLLLLFPPNAL
jgi:hypothetical protein